VNCSPVAFNVNFNLATNKKNHHTDLYRTGSSSEKLILRRGATFNIVVTPSGSGNVSSFRLTPIDSISGQPITQFPSISIPFVSSKDPSKWGYSSSDGKTYTINVPVNAIVGAFRFDVIGTTAYPTTQQVVVLFNPWSSADAVYMSDSTDLDEYILNEDGMMWLGSSPQSSTGWTYDQFDNDVLEVTLVLLDSLTYSYRNDIIEVARYLSSVINANNGGGLLYGRWQDPYTGGQAPWYWTGSGEIFSLYHKNQQTVKWAQCWVFAGTLTTAGRTIGIPARQITNFQSAHESSQYGPYRSSIDYLFDASGEQKGMLGSIWNFHAWVEFYFSRVDLSSGDGWQVVDATPQEPSDGEYKLGPASKQKILNKDLDADYDTHFVESEVDAVVRQYVPYDTGKAKHPFLNGYWLLSEEKGQTGKWISTKAKASSKRNDVTTSYKTVFSKPQKVPEDDQEVFFQSSVPPLLVLGSEFTAKIYAKCLICSNTTRSFSLYYEASIIDYTGQPAYLILQNITNIKLPDNQLYYYEVAISRKLYEHFVNDYSGIQFSYFSKVYDSSGTWTGASYGERAQIEIEFPELNITVRNVSTSSFLIDVYLHNPLSIPLTGVYLFISGAHVSSQQISVNDVAGDGDLNLTGIVGTLNDVAVRHECNLYIKLISNEVSQFDGNAVIHEYTVKK